VTALATAWMVALAACAGDFADRGATGEDCTTPPCRAGDDTGPPGPVPDGPDGGTQWSPSDSDPLPASTLEPSAGVGRYEDGDLGAASCFDGADNNDADGVDCADPACSFLGSCRVGSGDFCAGLGAVTLDFSTCSPSVDPVDCFAATTDAFGPVRWVAGGVFHPGGDERSDAGIVLETVHDLRSQRVEITAALSSSDCTDCIESAGVALTAQTSFTATTQLQPIVALLLGAARDEALLVVGGEVVGVHPVEGPREEWRLTVRPTGRVTAERVDGTGSLLESSFVPAAAARVALYGKNTNHSPGTTGGAGIERATVARGQCEIPTIWNARDELDVLTVTRTTLDVSAARGLTADYGPDGSLAVAFERGGSVLFGGRSGGPELALAHPESVPALAVDDGDWFDAIADPELFVRADERWAMLFTGAYVGGRKTIGLAVQDAVGAPTFTPHATPVVLPGAEDDLTEVEMPSVTRIEGDLLVMSARGTHVDGAQSLVLYVSSDDGETWRRHFSRELDALTRREGQRVGSDFDADEIAYPSLAVVAGSYQLYYAGRRGTRWAVGLLATDALINWRDAGQVFGRGGPDAFDRFGPVEVDVAVAGNRAELFYVGTDGATNGLGVATRATGAEAL
jgi:hypothetical protein